jgi:hypothetical protein
MTLNISRSAWLALIMEMSDVLASDSLTATPQAGSLLIAAVNNNDSIAQRIWGFLLALYQQNENQLEGLVVSCSLDTCCARK